MKQGIYKIETGDFTGTFVEEIELVQLAISLSIEIRFETKKYVFSGKSIQLMTKDKEIVSDFIDYDLAVGFNPFEYEARWENRFNNIKGITEEDFEELDLKELTQKIYAISTSS